MHVCERIGDRKRPGHRRTPGKDNSDAEENHQVIERRLMNHVDGESSLVSEETLDGVDAVTDRLVQLGTRA